MGVQLDGKPWFAMDAGEIIIPRGVHKIEFLKEQSTYSAAHVLLISGELVSAEFNPRSLNLNYIEDIAPCYVTVDKQPSNVKVDNVTYVPEVFSNTVNRFTMKLPKGKHNIAIDF